ncbi:CheY-like chemotaxis protein [Mycolicibacterium fluoranthenivorans]|uniref:CheY-like chemotaxis protein n=1 Tax=Mycolicibacterium fluoranthenivorans TaxID=258505 RepID=A0A7X5U1N5_9MYCO|nr:CheY-like chemotaxis protein [Mycolicibacterium fluoranthenivorans]
MTSLAESPDWRIGVAESNGPDPHDSNAPVRALIVDGEPLIRELMSIALRHEGWKVATAGDGATALRSARQTAPDIVVLDVELPDMDGLEVMRALREQTRGLPVLFLSARASVEDRIAGLEHGCDDYVSKPFSLQEVVLRLRALSNRSAAGPEVGGRLRIGDLVLDERSLRLRAPAGRWPCHSPNSVCCGTSCEILVASSPRPIFCRKSGARNSPEAPISSNCSFPIYAKRSTPGTPDDSHPAWRRLHPQAARSDRLPQLALDHG